MLDAYQYGQFWNGFKGADGMVTIGNRKKTFLIGRVGSYESMNYDWLDKAWSAAYSTKHNVNISGGGNNSSYFGSISYQSQEGNLSMLDATVGIIV